MCCCICPSAIFTRFPVLNWIGTRAPYSSTSPSARTFCLSAPQSLKRDAEQRYPGLRRPAPAPLATASGDRLNEGALPCGMPAIGIDPCGGLISYVGGGASYDVEGIEYGCGPGPPPPRLCVRPAHKTPRTRRKPYLTRLETLEPEAGREGSGSGPAVPALGPGPCSAAGGPVPEPVPGSTRRSVSADGEVVLWVEVETGTWGCGAFWAMALDCAIWSWIILTCRHSIAVSNSAVNASIRTMNANHRRHANSGIGPRARTSVSASASDMRASTLHEPHVCAHHWRHWPTCASLPSNHMVPGGSPSTESSCSPQTPRQDLADIAQPPPRTRQARSPARSARSSPAQGCPAPGVPPHIHCVSAHCRMAL
eukprot:3058688-Rhodomonas_salina.1